MFDAETPPLEARMHSEATLAQWLPRTIRRCENASETLKSRLRIEALCNAWGTRHLGPLLSLDDHGYPAAYSPTVYFLVRDDEITYVGSTMNLILRLGSHTRHGRRFDAVLYFSRLPPKGFRHLESCYILALRPVENAFKPVLPKGFRPTTLHALGPSGPVQASPSVFERFLART